MADVARPRLAEVLAALTGTKLDLWRFSERDSVLVAAARAAWAPPGPGWFTASNPWTTTDPAEAQETLVTRRLLPEGWCDAVRRGWAQHRSECPRCGVGCYPLDESRGVCVCDAACNLCNDPAREVGASPCTIPDLVAVASLGVPALLRAETLARDACASLREHGCPQPELVVWRVGDRRETKDCVLAHAWVSGSAEQILSCEGRWYAGSTRDGIVIRKRSWAGDVGAACALWKMGLALDAITADAVRIVVPPVGGGRG